MTKFPWERYFFVVVVTLNLFHFQVNIQRSMMSDDVWRAFMNCIFKLLIPQKCRQKRSQQHSNQIDIVFNDVDQKLCTVFRFFLHWYALNFNITFKVQEMLYFLHFMKVITLLIAISVVDEIVYKTFTSLNNLIWNRECEEISESIANINLTLFTFSCLMSTAKILNQQERVIYHSTTNVINYPSL